MQTASSSTKSPTARPKVARLSAASRSRLSNGKEVLPDIDGRSAMARRYRDIAAQIVTDQGGIDQCSESRQQLIRRFSAACVLAEQMEAKLVEGHEVSITDHAQLCSTLVRISARIGINRRLRNVTPALADYLDDHAANRSHDSDLKSSHESFSELAS
jgi:hypothetical protein